MRIKERLALLLLVKMASALECFRNTQDFNTEVQYCNPTQFPYCLKADAFDGNVYRACGAAEQCPQGPSCAPIIYDEDQTTDYVCCCTTPLCNSAFTYKSSFALVTVLIFAVIFTVVRL